uniref:(northern house mosquito) hypothetical protein n=1 Tax=Culex pipiens TaxID=7175 RepID=A0A8D8A766_CULPI
MLILFFSSVPSSLLAVTGLRKCWAAPFRRCSDSQRWTAASIEFCPDRNPRRQGHRHEPVQHHSDRAEEDAQKGLGAGRRKSGPLVLAPPVRESVHRRGASGA